MILGVVATLVALFFASVLRLFLTRFTHRSFNNVIPYLRPDGEEILRDLMNASMERLLADSLSHKQFREEQQDRMRIADEYLSHRAHNALVLQGWGDTELRKAQKMGDAEMQTAAQALVEACAQYRIGASCLKLQLHLWQFKLVLLPFARLPRISRLRKVDEFDVFTAYEHLAEAALKLAEACGVGYYDRLLEAL